MATQFTGIILPDAEAHAAYVQFDTKDDGSVEFRAFAQAHPGTTPVMYVGEPGDPDDSARWIVTINESGECAWRVPAADEELFA